MSSRGNFFCKAVRIIDNTSNYWGTTDPADVLIILMNSRPFDIGVGSVQFKSHVSRMDKHIKCIIDCDNFMRWSQGLCVCCQAWRPMEDITINRWVLSLCNFAPRNVIPRGWSQFGHRKLPVHVHMMETDKALGLLGRYNKRRLLVYIAVSLGSNFMASWMYMSVIFVGNAFAWFKSAHYLFIVP